MCAAVPDRSARHDVRLRRGARCRHRGGGGRSAAELALDLRTQAARLARSSRPGRRARRAAVERVPGGQLIAAERVPFMRLREVVWHHVDLDAGYGFADTPDELVPSSSTTRSQRLVATAPPGSRSGPTRATSTVGDGRARPSPVRGGAALAGAGSHRRAAASTVPDPAVRRLSHVRHSIPAESCRWAW